MKSEDSGKGAGKRGGDDSERQHTFEQAIERLESIVERLEAGELTLEESINVYEEGVKLAGFCAGKLDEAEHRVEILVKQADDKNAAVPLKVENSVGRTPDQEDKEEKG